MPLSSQTDESKLILPRLFRLFEIFVRYPGKEFTHSQLVEWTGYPASTMTRLLQALKMHCSLGELSERKEGRSKYYRMDFINRVKRPLNNDEALALSLNRDIAAGILPADYKDISENAVSKAVATLLLDLNQHESVTIAVAQTRYMGNVDYSAIKGIKEITDTAHRCIREKRVCMLEYHHLKTSEPKCIEVAPLKLQIHHDSIYMVGWEVGDKGTPLPIKDVISHYALHRIRKITSTRRKHTLTLPAEDMFQYYGFPIDPPTKIRVQFTKEVAQYVKERLWSRDQDIEDQPDGSCILTFYTQSMREAFSKIMSFGVEATVLEPESLKERMRFEAMRLLSRYGKNGL